MKSLVAAQYVLALILLAACAPARLDAAEPFAKEIQAYEDADRKNPPPQGAVLFIGSSSIRRWQTLQTDFPEHTVINRGFGGSHLSDSVKFAERIVIPYKPRLIVIHAGGNDIDAGKSPQRICDDFKAFVEKVRAALPDARIAYMSMSPQPKRWARAEEHKKVNQLIKEYVASQKNLDFIDLWDGFMAPDGKPREELFIADMIHNNAEGYKIRAALTRPHLVGFETKAGN